MSIPRVRSDVFPATVTVTTPESPTPQVFEKSRVVLTTDTAYVFQDSPKGPDLVYSSPLNEYDPGVPIHRRTRSTPARMPSALLADGSSLTFVRSAGCGCGSRLKGFDPFSHPALSTASGSSIAAASSSKDR